MIDITTQELRERIRNKEALHIVDVREEFEYDEFNIGAQNIPLGDLPRELDKLNHLKKEELIVHCRSGNRSETAKKYLMSQGFQNVRNLLGGMLKWKEEEE